MDAENTHNKSAPQPSRDAKEYAEDIVDTMPDALLVLDTALRVRSANDAFYTTFQVQRHATEGQLIYELGNGQWDIPKLRMLLEDILPKNKVFIGYEVDHYFEQLGQRIMVLNGRQLDHVPLILLIITDITQRKQAEEAVRQLNKQLEERDVERAAHTEQIRQLVTQLTMSEQEERRRISAILHDDVQQRLFSVNFQLTMLRERLESTDADAAQEVIEIEDAVRTITEVTRVLSVDLSPPVLHNEGLTEALLWLAGQMKEQHGFTVTVESNNRLSPMDEDLRVLLYHSVRELLFNVVKHAKVTAALVRVTHEELSILIDISDQGRGFNVDVVANSDGQGLPRIAQRLQLIGGHMQIESGVDKGMHVTLSAPLRSYKGA